MVVGHRSRDGIGATTDGLVQVLVAYAAETQDSPAQVERGVAAAVAPVDHGRVRVERARIGERSAQRGGVVFIDGRGTEAQLYVGRCHVVDGDAGARRPVHAVLIGDGDCDGEAAAAGRLIEVLVVDGAELQGPRGQNDRVGAAVAPVNADRVYVIDTGITEAAGERGRVVLIDRRGAEIQRDARSLEARGREHTELRRIGNLADVQGDGGDVGVMAVIGLVGETIQAEELGRRRVGEGAVGGKNQGAVAGCIYQAGCHRLAG